MKSVAAKTDRSAPAATAADATAAAWNVQRVRYGPLLRHGRLALLPELERVHREGGDFVELRVMGSFRFFVVSDPEAIEQLLVRKHRNMIRGEPEWTHLRRALGDGLVTSDGELHRRQRRLILPAFQPRRVAQYAETVGEVTGRMAQDWEARCDQVVDVNAEMMRLTMLVISEVLFGLDLSVHAGPLSRAVTAINAATVTVDLSLAGYWPWAPTRANRELRRSIRYVDQLFARIVEDRRASHEDHGDVLSLLLGAQAERADGAGADPPLTDRQIRDEIVTLFAAGHETTANMLSWTWMLLARNPDAEARLHAELDAVLSGRPPRFEDLPKLEYTERVLRESMRLYPPVWGNQRLAEQADVITGRPVPARAQIAAVPWLVHRDARWFPDPLRFDPDRFLPEAVRERPHFAYFPFGGGDRRCIGESFAEMEASLVLATLAQRFTPRLDPTHEVVPEPMVSLRPWRGLPMKLVPRKG